TGAISGPGGLTTDGPGGLRLAGTTANTHSGVTTLNAGLLVLTKPSGVTAIPADLDIVAGTVDFGASIFVPASDQIADTATVTVRGQGVLDLDGNSDRIHALVLFNGSDVTTANGILSLDGDITHNFVTGNTSSAVISGRLNLVGTGSQRITVADTTLQPEDLVISAVIGGAGFQKFGPGRLQLTHANTFNGLVEIAG